MNHLDLLAHLNINFRTAPSGSGYGYEAIRMCPACKNGHTSRHELIEVLPEIFVELQAASSDAQRREIMKARAPKHAGKNFWVPIEQTEVPDDGRAIVVPYGAWDEYIQRRLRGS